jgi:hypothetical protein
MRLAPLFFALAGGCAASFVTPYDAVLDGRVTELHAKIETFLDTVDLAAGSPDAAYRTNWHFYLECVSEAQTLSRRATADGRAEIARTLGEIAVTVEQLRRAHEAAGTLDRALTQQVRSTLRDSFDGFYRRQSAVRRGL